MQAFPRPAEVDCILHPPDNRGTTFLTTTEGDADILKAAREEDPNLLWMVESENGGNDDGDDPWYEKYSYHYEYGCDWESGCRKAWRKLVDKYGQTIVKKEFAYDCKRPEDGYGGFIHGGKMIALFTDGNQHEIPNMFYYKPASRSPSPSPIKKRKRGGGAPNSCKRSSSRHDGGAAGTGGAHDGDGVAQDGDADGHAGAGGESKDGDQPVQAHGGSLATEGESKEPGESEEGDKSEDGEGCEPEDGEGCESENGDGEGDESEDGEGCESENGDGEDVESEDVESGWTKDSESESPVMWFLYLGKHVMTQGLTTNNGHLYTVMDVRQESKTLELQPLCPREGSRLWMPASKARVLEDDELIPLLKEGVGPFHGWHYGIKAII